MIRTAINVVIGFFLIISFAAPAFAVPLIRDAEIEHTLRMYADPIFKVDGLKPSSIHIFIVEDDSLKMDLGRAQVVALPQEETERRWNLTTPQWPIMHAVLKGISRDQMMARHKANHIQVVYAPGKKQAERACRIKAAFLAELGLEVHFCGDLG